MQEQILDIPAAPLCHLCGHMPCRDVLQAAKQAGFPHRIRYVYCPRCSFVSFAEDVDAFDGRYREWQRDNPRPSSITDYHDHEVRGTNSAMTSLRSTTAIAPASHEMLWNGEGRTLADVGCGAGGSLTAWASHGWTTVGVEPGDDGRQAADALGLDIRVEPYTAGTFTEGSLGMIYSNHALEHFTRPFEAIANFAFHLQADGLLHLETPDVLDSEWSQLGYDHWSLFSPRTLTGALTAAGFQVIAMVERRNYGTHGVAVLAQKRQAAVAPGTEFLPAHAIDWTPKGYWRTWIALHHAFHGGRGRDLSSWTAPIKLARSTVKSLLPEGAKDQLRRLLRH